MNSTKSILNLDWCFKQYPPEFSTTLTATYITTIIINIVTSPVAVVGNVLILVLIYKYHTLRKPCNILIASLAFSDTLVGLIVQPLLVARRILDFGRKQYCSLRFMYVWGSYVLFFLTLSNVALVSLDRYMMIAKPFAYNNIASTKHYLVFLSVMWISMNIFINLYCLGIVKTETYMLLETALMFVPLIVIIGCSVALYSIAVKQRNMIIVLHHTETSNRSSVSKKANSILILVFVLLVCYLPQIVLLTYRGVFGASIANYTIPDTWFDTLTFINSSINPFVFCYRIKEFKKALMKLLGRRDLAREAISVQHETHL